MATRPKATGINIILPPSQVPAEAPLRYRANVSTTARQLLPVVLRRPLLLEWVRVLTAPAAALYAEFVVYLYQTRRSLSYNSQVLLFERALNDRFDPTARRIRIVNADTQFSITYDNFRIEQQPDQYMLQRSEMPPFAYDRSWLEYSTQTDFIVYAPPVLNGKAVQMHSLIKRMKLATKRYQLIYTSNIPTTY